MKNILRLTLFAFLAFGMFACGEKKLTQEDLRAAEAMMMGENWTMNKEVAPKVAEKYLKFVEQSPNDSTASTWLFHALEIYVTLKDSDKSIEVGNKLVEQYPESRWAPRALLIMGNYVYDDQLHDLDMARATYEKLLNDYPDSELVDDAQKLIGYLGMTPEEIMADIMMSQMEEEEAVDF